MIDANITVDTETDTETTEKKTRRPKAPRRDDLPRVSLKEFVAAAIKAHAQGMEVMTNDFLASELNWPTDSEALKTLRNRYRSYQKGDEKAGRPPLPLMDLEEMTKGRGPRGPRYDYDDLAEQLKAAGL